MKKTLINLLAVVVVFVFAIHAGAASDRQSPREEKMAASLAQFGLSVDSVKADIPGNIPSWAYAGLAVKQPLGFGARGNWEIVPAAMPSAEQKEGYARKIYDAIIAVADDGKVHGSKTNGEFDQVLSFDLARKKWVWGYIYKECYVDVYLSAENKEFGVELVYAGRKAGVADPAKSSNSYTKLGADKSAQLMNKMDLPKYPYGVISHTNLYQDNSGIVYIRNTSLEECRKYCRSLSSFTPQFSDSNTDGKTLSYACQNGNKTFDFVITYLVKPKTQNYTLNGEKKSQSWQMEIKFTPVKP